MKLSEFVNLIEHYFGDPEIVGVRVREELNPFYMSDEETQIVITTSLNPKTLIANNVTTSQLREALCAIVRDSKLGGIVCPKCGCRSYNPNDIENRYCGSCHAFHDDMKSSTEIRFSLLELD